LRGSIDSGPVVRQNIMVVGVCGGGGCSLHGTEEVERGREGEREREREKRERARKKYHHRPISMDLLPPAWPHLLWFPQPPTSWEPVL
jgi:hypothetical protein